MVNRTQKPVAIASMVLEGKGFALDSPKVEPRTLKPGDSFEIRVRFSPTAEHPYTGKLTFKFDGGLHKQVIDISGGGTK